MTPANQNMEQLLRRCSLPNPLIKGIKEILGSLWGKRHQRRARRQGSTGNGKELRILHQDYAQHSWYHCASPPDSSGLQHLSCKTGRSRNQLQTTTRTTPLLGCTISSTKHRSSFEPKIHSIWASKLGQDSHKFNNHYPFDLFFPGDVEITVSRRGHHMHLASLNRICAMSDSI